jgi:hypothetical protein
MQITPYGRAEVQTDRFKANLYLLLLQLYCKGEDARNVRCTMETYVAMVLCMDADDSVAMHDSELGPFIEKHNAEIDQILQGGMQYAQKMGGPEEAASYNPTMRYSASVH